MSAGRHARRTHGLVAALLGGCAPFAPPAEVPREPSERSVGSERPIEPGAVALRVDFAPPLTEPGVLFVEHECGLRLRAATGYSGVDLQLPPGPASVRLQAQGREWVVPVVVGLVPQVVISRTP